MRTTLNKAFVAAQAYRNAAQAALTERLAARPIDAEQRAAHGFAWVATTVAALEAVLDWLEAGADRSEEHTSELQSLMRISYAVFCLKKKKNKNKITTKLNS